MAFPDLSGVRDIYQALGSYCQLAIGAYSEQSFDFDVLEFSKKYDFEPIQVLNSTKLLAQEGYIYASEQVYQPATLQIIAKREVLYDYELRNPNQYKLLRVILRSYQGIHAQAANINEPKLAKDLGLTVPDLEKFLLQLQKAEIIQYTPLKDTPQIGFLTERLPIQNLQINRERYDFLRTRYKSRIDACLDYAERLQCRSQALLKYFDELNPPRCGKCDACTGVHNAQLTNEQLEVFKQQIAPILKQRPQQMADLCKHFPTNQHARLVKAIGFLIDNRLIGYDKGKNLQWLG
jgi:ATP-dependent DNA helicase RecQ